MSLKGQITVLTYLIAATFMNFTPARADAPTKTILFLGDSLTAGYGVVPEASYPALIEKKIKARGWNFDVINAGISGDTTAGGLRRLDWLLKRRVDVLVLALGANDGLRGLPTQNAGENLRKIIQIVREKYPDVEVLIAGMLIPPSMGGEYARRFQDTFRQVASAEDATLIPFLLEGVAAEENLNLNDGIHPNEAGYRKVAETVWRALEPVLEKVHAAK